MRILIIFLAVVAETGFAANADTADDVKFARDMLFNKCHHREFKPQEMERLHAIDQSQPEPRDQQGQMAYHAAHDALNCQVVSLPALRAAEQEKLEKLRFQAIVASSPVCTEAFATSDSLNPLSVLVEMARGARLAEAGDLDSGCPQMDGLAAKLDNSRLALLNCFKSMHEEGDESNVREEALKRAQQANQNKNELLLTAERLIAPGRRGADALSSKMHRCRRGRPR